MHSLDQIPKKMSDVKVSIIIVLFKILHCKCYLINTIFIQQVSTCSAFAQTLRRYTSLNHLAQAARAVLQNSSQISQMLTDLNRVDFANVQVRMFFGY